LIQNQSLKLGTKHFNNAFENKNIIKKKYTINKKQQK